MIRKRPYTQAVGRSVSRFTGALGRKEIERGGWKEKVGFRFVSSDRPGLLTDSLVASPIVNSGAPQDGGMEGVESTGAGGSNGFEFGIDPSADPELAIALRLSMEEEQNRLERERRTREEQSGERMETITEEANDSKQPRVEDDKTDGKS